MEKQHELTNLIAWLETQQGMGLISDDMGRWAVSSGGMQNLPPPDEFDDPFDFVGYFDVEKGHWRDSILEALRYGRERYKD